MTVYTNYEEEKGYYDLQYGIAAVDLKLKNVTMSKGEIIDIQMQGKT